MAKHMVRLRTSIKSDPEDLQYMDYAPLKNMASLWRAGNDAPGGLPDLCWCQFHLCPCSKANLRFKRYSIFFQFH